MLPQQISTILADIAAHDGRELLVAGWARTIRDLKNLAFIDLSDGSAFSGLQIVLTPERVRNFAEIVAEGSGAAFRIRGILRATPAGKQPCELEATEILLEGATRPDYPLQPKRHSPEFLRSIPHLRPRARLFTAVFRVRSETAHAIHEFFHDRGFLLVHTPLITSIDAEGAGDMFRVTTLDEKNPPLTEAGGVDWSQDFFEKKTSLTVTGQLGAEAFAQAFSRVYTFGPTFRAENSNTPRHAAEFWMVEPEVAFAALGDIMQLAEDMLRHLVRSILVRCPEELAFCNRFVAPGLLERLEKVAGASFARMSYTAAISRLEAVRERFQYPIFWGSDLQTEHERYLTEEVVGGPVFVTDWPRDLKAFYMRQNEDGRTVAAMDCLVPGVGEIVGGSQREERLDRLEARLAELGMDTEALDWYLDLRRFGTTRHAGYGLGFERMVMYLTGVGNIRDVSAFPRTTGTALF